MSKLARGFLPLFVIMIMVYIAYTISQSKPQASDGKKPEVKPLSVATQTLSPDNFNITVNSFGIVQAKTKTQLFPQVGGLVTAVSPVFESGGFVRQGDVLLEIEAADYAVEVQGARSNLANAKLQLAEEEARYAQAQRDWKKQIEPSLASQYALREPQLNAARVNLETARARLGLAELNLKRTKVKAPYDGRLLETHVDVGTVLNVGTNIATMYSSDAVEVRLPIAARDLPFVDLPEPTLNGEPMSEIPVVIENTMVQPPELWSAKVVRTDGAIDGETQQLYVVARIESPFEVSENRAKGLQHKRPLKIGQYVKARIQGRDLPDSIVVPNASIYQGSYVYVVEGDTLQRRNISVLWRNDDVSVIGYGLTSGEQVVTTLLGQVASGTRVKVDNEAASQEPRP